LFARNIQFIGTLSDLLLEKLSSAETWTWHFVVQNLAVHRRRKCGATEKTH